MMQGERRWARVVLPEPTGPVMPMAMGPGRAAAAERMRSAAVCQARVIGSCMGDGWGRKGRILVSIAEEMGHRPMPPASTCLWEPHGTVQRRDRRVRADGHRRGALEEPA